MERQAGWVGGAGGLKTEMQRNVVAHRKQTLTYVGARGVGLGGRRVGGVQGEEWSRETPRSCGEKGVIILSQTITVTHKHTTTAA